MSISEERSSATSGWALVTGGASRGGAAMCRMLHARGMSVVIHHSPRSLAAAQALRDALLTRRPGSVRLWEADFLATGFALPDWLPTLGITVLVCNASQYKPSRVGDLQAFRDDFEVHVVAHARILAALQPDPRASLGYAPLSSVVAISDIAVDRAPVGHIGYTTAKGALETMVLALANDWAPHTRCNVVQVGTLPFPETWTDVVRADKIMASIPLARIGTFEDLAGAVVFLALDARYITGQKLAVDGGRNRFLL